MTRHSSSQNAISTCYPNFQARGIKLVKSGKVKREKQNSARAPPDRSRHGTGFLRPLCVIRWNGLVDRQYYPILRSRALCSARPLACDFWKPGAGSAKATPGPRSRCRSKDAVLMPGSPAVGPPIHNGRSSGIYGHRPVRPRRSRITCLSRYSFNSLTIREGEKPGLFAHNPRPIDSCVGTCHMANARNRRDGRPDSATNPGFQAHSGVGAFTGNVGQFCAIVLRSYTLVYWTQRQSFDNGSFEGTRSR